MGGTWRRIAAIVSAICALVLLPIATNIATGIALPDFIIRSKWPSWLGVVVFGLIAVSAIFRTRLDPGPDATSEQDRRVSADPDRDVDEKPSLAATLETAPVLLGALPERVRGRDSLLSRLQKHQREGGLVVLVGAGGTGKSTVARELIRRTRPNDETSELAPAWEVSGAALRDLVDGLRSVADSLGADSEALAAIQAPDPSGPDSLWQVLDRGPKGWVLIIDNADDTKFLAKPAESDARRLPRLTDGTGWVRASEQGLVIVTSRQREKRLWPTAATVYPVGLLSEAQAAQILRDLAPNAGNRTQARALARRLGRLPLALRLAGLYLGSSFALHSSFDAYREALESDPTAIQFIDLHASDPEAAERMMVMLTWELSLDALAKYGLPQARPLLRLLSCYAPAVPIPLSLFDSERTHSFLNAAVVGNRTATPSRVDQVLMGLDQLGLIDAVSPSRGKAAEKNPELTGRGLVVHPVVADTNRTYLIQPRPGDPPEPLVRQTAVALLATALDELDYERPSTWPTFRMLAPHLQALLINSAPRLDAAPLESLTKVAGATATAYGQMNSPEFGIALITSALGQCQRHGAAAGPTVPVVRQFLANLLGDVGRDAEAEEIYRDVLGSQLRDWPSDDPANLVARHNLTASVARRVPWSEAQSALHDILKDERQMLGDDHPITLATRMEYAALLGRHGRWKDAEILLRRIVSDATRALGGNSHFTLAARHNLTHAIWRQERWGDAESAVRDLMEDERRVLSDDHVVTVATSRHAEGGLLSVFRLSTAALHEQFAAFLFSKGVMMEEDDRDEALKAFEDLISRFANDTSPAIRELVGQAMFNKAVILHNQDEPEGAAGAYDDLIDGFFDDGSPFLRELVAMALVNRAIILRDEPEQALQAIKQAVARYQELAESDPGFEAKLDSARQLLDQMNADAAASMFDTAASLRREGRLEEAVEAYGRLDDRYRDDPSPRIRELVAKALFAKAVILHGLGQPDEDTDA